jgi:hypothetical protein
MEKQGTKRLFVSYIGVLLAVALTASGCLAVKGYGAYALYEHGNVDSEKAALLADYRKCVEAGGQDCKRFAPPDSTSDVHVIASDDPHSNEK